MKSAADSIMSRDLSDTQAYVRQITASLTGQLNGILKGVQGMPALAYEGINVSVEKGGIKITGVEAFVNSKRQKTDATGEKVAAQSAAEGKKAEKSPGDQLSSQVRAAVRTVGDVNKNSLQSAVAGIAVPEGTKQGAIIQDVRGPAGQIFRVWANHGNLSVSKLSGQRQ